MCSLDEHQKCFIASGPGNTQVKLVIQIQQNYNNIKRLKGSGNCYMITRCGSSVTYRMKHKMNRH